DRAFDAAGEKANADLLALYRIAELAARRGPDLSETAAELLRVTVDRVGADRGCVLLAAKGGGRITPLATCVADGSDAPSIPVSRSIVDYVVRHGAGVRTTDARADDRFDSGQSIVRAGIREALCVPIEGRDGTQGVIYVDTTPSSIDVLADDDGPMFDDDRLNWLMAVGRQCGLAVDNDRYEKAIVRAERLATMGRTVAHLSHHVKNIVQGLKGGAFLIDRGLEQDDEEQIRRGWAVTSRNQARINDFVQDMLSFSKERSPVLEPGDLNAVVLDVAELARGRMPERPVTLHTDLTEPSPRALFDEDALHRAVLNVVLNAVEAVDGHEDPTVRVRTGLSDDRTTAFISVVDNGPGIPEMQLDTIFTPFESSKGARGTGLGLPVTRKILREHGGDVRAESVPGEGSRFILTVPAETLTSPDTV
ncbi:MAG: ATP-binding protein, partial [Planctomycetota bacterium]